jgi:hypothetical protein
VDTATLRVTQIKGSASPEQMSIFPGLRMNIGDVVTHRGREVVLLGLEPMSVPDRQAHVRDVETGEELHVAYDELEERGGLAPTA